MTTDLGYGKHFEINMQSYTYRYILMTRVAVLGAYVLRTRVTVFGAYMLRTRVAVLGAQ